MAILSCEIKERSWKDKASGTGKRQSSGVLIDHLECFGYLGTSAGLRFKVTTIQGLSSG